MVTSQESTEYLGALNGQRPVGRKDVNCIEISRNQILALVNMK
jgi:hypothetical protein